VADNASPVPAEVCPSLRSRVSINSQARNGFERINRLAERLTRNERPLTEELAELKRFYDEGEIVELMAPADCSTASTALTTCWRWSRPSPRLRAGSRPPSRHEAGFERSAAEVLEDNQPTFSPQHDQHWVDW
jgi:hypothetical protein